MGITDHIHHALHVAAPHGQPFEGSDRPVTNETVHKMRGYVDVVKEIAHGQTSWKVCVEQNGVEQVVGQKGRYPYFHVGAVYSDQELLENRRALSGL